MRLLQTMASRATAKLVNAGVPPSWLGYRRLRTESPQQYLARIDDRHDGSLGRCAEISPPGVSKVPLPANVPSRDQLSRDGQSWRTHLHEVPERPVPATYFAEVVDCTVLAHYDRMDDGWFAILGRDGRQLDVRGTTYLRAHADLLRRAADAPVIERAAWISEYWYTNYFHWLNCHLPKVALLNSCGWRGPLLMPARSKLYPVFEESLARLGVDARRILRIEAPVTRVKRLTVVGLDAYPGDLLRQVRDAICGPMDAAPSRLLYASRERAGWRRATNEADVVGRVERFGFEKVAMDGLSFAQQVNLMKEARVLLSIHGAGLANMLFAPEGADVIEIVDPDFPEPDYYAMASALRHRYWMVKGIPADPSARPGYRDLTVDLDALEPVLEAIAGARR